MSIITGLENPSSGVVKTSSRAGIIFQEPDTQILGETPKEDAAFGPRNLGLSKEECASRVETALIETGLRERADFPARSLSGGEKRRLATAGVLAMGTQIIIFDEPYANMDLTGVLHINNILKKLISNGRTVIILTHEIEKCLALADHFIVLSKGKKVFDGTPVQALSCDLQTWGIHHPLDNPPKKSEDLLWL
jgi:biotin transport system ATP-binding protein